MWSRRSAIAVMVWLATTYAASGIILLDDDGTSLAVRSTPGDNSGWQYEGNFDGYCATPIASYYFITAGHIGGEVGDIFTFHGETFSTTARYDDPFPTDLRIWKVDHAFTDYAPLYHAQDRSEIGKELRVFGYGLQRGDARILDGRLRGWNASPSDGYAQRWGRNVVTDIVTPSRYWPFLVVNFDSPGLIHEAFLSANDSGGGVFILEDGLWRLAAINYAIDDLFTGPSDSTDFTAAIFDARGYYTKDDTGNFVQIPDESVNVPLSFYSTQISPRLTWIESITCIDPTTLPLESYANWQRAYLAPFQIADAALGGASADTDGDGITNLMEFAFNLDPTYAEPVMMIADTGLRGQPLIRLEQVAASDTRLTVEFVRRKPSSGSGLTYTAQFTSDLATPTSWQAGGTAVVTSINARWERVKVTDTVNISVNTPRFARVAVSQ